MEATIRVPVPREFLLRAGLTEGEEGEMVMRPTMMRKVPLTLGDHELGDWYVVGTEITMERGQFQRADLGEPRVLTGIQPPPLALVPTYWATLSRVLP